MVTIAPIILFTALVCWNPEGVGGSINPLLMLAGSVFVLFTTELWPTYIPAVVLTPLIVRQVARMQSFQNLPMLFLLSIAFVLGFIAGVGVVSIIVPWHESAKVISALCAAGGVSGGVTLAIISFIFRYEPRVA